MIVLSTIVIWSKRCRIARDLGVFDCECSVVSGRWCWWVVGGGGLPLVGRELRHTWPHPVTSSHRSSSLAIPAAPVPIYIQLLLIFSSSKSTPWIHSQGSAVREQMAFPLLENLNQFSVTAAAGCYHSVLVAN